MRTTVPSTDGLALVTGASSGIGEHLARGLAARGYPLLLLARRTDRLKALADELTAAHGVKVELHGCDLSDREARAALCSTLARRPVSILCSNAGFATFGSFVTLDPVREREQVELNSVAVHDLVAAVLPGMVERGNGAVLITGSTAGHQPMPGAATYAATKAFANTFSEALHAELKGTGVTCTLLAPGPVRTGFAAAAGVAHLEGVGASFAWLSAERVAQEALTGMFAGKRCVVPGLFAKCETVTGRYMPRAVLLPVLRVVLERARR